MREYWRNNQNDPLAKTKLQKAICCFDTVEKENGQPKVCYIPDNNNKYSLPELCKMPTGLQSYSFIEKCVCERDDVDTMLCVKRLSDTCRPHDTLVCKNKDETSFIRQKKHGCYCYTPTFDKIDASCESQVFSKKVLCSEEDITEVFYPPYKPITTEKDTPCSILKKAPSS